MQDITVKKIAESVKKLIMCVTVILRMCNWDVTLIHECCYSNYIEIQN